MERKKFVGPQANRDYIICHLYLQGRTSDEIAAHLLEKKIWDGSPESVARLCRLVIYKKREFLKLDVEYERVKDALRIEREIPNRPLGKKDKIDLIKAKHEILRSGKDSDKIATGTRIYIVNGTTESREKLGDRFKSLPDAIFIQ